ncbi:MAG TPA: hypothetical protein VHO26_03945 [Propionibacteriaceae bacterium]|nr:hypothetical protein [Propionibacteriaceae bacterium]
MADQDDLDGVHVWTNGRPDAGYRPAVTDTQPLPPMPPPARPGRGRRGSRAPLFVAALVAAGLLGAGSTAALTALMSHDGPVAGTNGPANPPAGQRAGQAPGNGRHLGQQAPRQHIRGGDSGRGDDGGDDGGGD